MGRKKTWAERRQGWKAAIRFQNLRLAAHSAGVYAHCGQLALQTTAAAEITMRVVRLGLLLALSTMTVLAGCTEDPAQRELQISSGELDQQLGKSLASLIASAKVDPEGDVFLNLAPLDRRFSDQESGLYFQISGAGREDFRSRSLWERRLKVNGLKAATEPHYYNSEQFSNEPLRVAERTVKLPGSETEWQFLVAHARKATSS